MSESNMQNTHSPYTPDTGKVRTSYIHGVGGTTWYKGKADALLKQFDRWLIQERKRVSKFAIERLFSNLTRVTLIDDDRGGIQYERYGIKEVQFSVQDNKQTLKLFINGEK